MTMGTPFHAVTLAGIAVASSRGTSPAYQEAFATHTAGSYSPMAGRRAPASTTPDGTLR